jgi:hypothetical protein
MKLIRKSWIGIFPENILSNLKIRIKEKTSDDLDEGLTPIMINKLNQYYNKNNIII